MEKKLARKSRKYIVEFIKKNWQYSPAFVFLILVILITWYLFFSRLVVDDEDKRIAGILSILGLGFVLFQFWFNHITTGKRKIYDMRYVAYKEIIHQFNEIIDTLNAQLTVSEYIKISDLLVKLMNQLTRLVSTINVENNYLFP